MSARAKKKIYKSRRPCCLTSSQKIKGRRLPLICYEAKYKIIYMKKKKKNRNNNCIFSVNKIVCNTRKLGDLVVAVWLLLHTERKNHFSHSISYHQHPQMMLIRNYGFKNVFSVLRMQAHNFEKA